MGVLKSSSMQQGPMKKVEMDKFREPALLNRCLQANANQGML